MEPVLSWNLVKSHEPCPAIFTAASIDICCVAANIDTVAQHHLNIPSTHDLYVASLDMAGNTITMFMS
jgi:hypothetical protein